MFSFSWDHTYINKSLSCQFSLSFLGHLYRSTIFLSVCVQSKSRPHLYQSVIHLVICRLVNLSLVFQCGTCINQSSFCQFEFLGPHLYRSVIHLVNSVFRTALILVGQSYYQFSFRDHIYINRSFILSVRFSGPHLYRSVIHLVSSVFRTTPILISHFHVNLSFRGRTYIDQPSSMSVWVWVFRDCTYINQSSSMSVWVFGTAPISIGHSSCFINSTWVFGTAPISIDHLLVNLSLSLGLHLYQSTIFLSVCV